MATYDPISLRRPIAELERWAEKMVFWFEPQRIPLPVITIQSTSRGALGWFAWACWESRDGAILDEINFVPEHLGRDVFDIAETLMHELVHLANFAAGIKDCTSNQYHNSHFRDRAVAIAMTCTRTAKRGWSKTGLTPELRERIAGLYPDASAFDLFRLPPPPLRLPKGTRSGVTVHGGIEARDTGGVHVQEGKKKKLAKWTCLGRCASAWVASGTELHAECLECGSIFIRV